MSATWTIRPAERRDVPELLEIEVAQFPEPWTRSMLLDEISNVETRRYTVAVEGKTIIGYLGVMFVMDELHVNTLGTLPGHEGRGVATSLHERRLGGRQRERRPPGHAGSGASRTRERRSSTFASVSRPSGCARTTTNARAKTPSSSGPSSTNSTARTVRWSGGIGPRYRNKL